MRFFILFLALVSSAFAVNGITLGTLALDSTFVCISVKQDYTGDTNGNATAVVEYKATASGTWLPTYAPFTFIDRRATVNSLTNPYVNQLRCSIVGLIQNTAYDVRITWTDADGVTGTNPTSASVTTLVITPPTGGAQWYVDTSGSNGSGTSGSPFNNMASAVAAASAGDTINCAGAFSSATSITKSGSSGAWIKFQQWSGHTTATFSGTNNNITATGSYLWFYGLTVNAASASTPSTTLNNFLIPGSSNYIRIENCTFPNVSPNGNANPTTGNYGSSAIQGQAGCHHIYTVGNTIACSIPGVTDYNSSFAFGIHYEAGSSLLGTLIVSDNTMTGTLRDGVSSEGNSMGNGYRWNCDIYNNTITGLYDDQIEADGDDMNCRIWNNNLDTTNGNDCLSTAGVSVGPCYTFRNYLHGQGLAIKQGNSSPGPAYYLHNTISVTNGGPNGNAADGIADGGGPPASSLVTTLNNVFNTERYCFYQAGQSGGSVSVRGNSYNYDLLYSIPGGGYGYVASSWDYTTDYQTIANLRTGTAGTPDFSQQETNGISAAPLLNANGTLQAGSPAINAGLAIANFNGANTPWPYTNANPAMGIAEFSSGVVGSSSLNGKIILTGKIQIK